MIFFWFFLVACVAPYIVISWAFRQDKINQQTYLSFQRGQNATSVAKYSGSCPYIDNRGVLVQCSTPSPVVSSLVVSTSTPFLNVVPSPSEIVFSSQKYSMRLSFYDPNIGYFFPDKALVNCSAWNFEFRRCEGRVLLNQGKYSDWYGRGVACPSAIPDLAVVRVLSPAQLAGDWLCVDRGGAIVDNWLDFLLRYPDQIWTGSDLMKFPWGSEVVVQIGVR